MGPLPGVELFPNGSGPAAAVAFFVPVICAALLEGRLPLKPGAVFFIGLFVGLGAMLVVVLFISVRAQKESSSRRDDL